MLDDRFYWGTIRKSIVAFGNMFNNITIDRKDAAGTSIQTFKVPLAYAPKQKFLARIQQIPDLDNQTTQVSLPRMSFEMTGLTYDFNRKISPIQQNRNVNSGTAALNTQYAPTPYNIGVNLYLYAKNQDDGLQVIEQILPYFNPDYNLTFKAIPALNIKNDLPILLDNISFQDEYEGDFTTRRSIIWTLEFTMKLNFYGPVSRQGIITKVTANTYNNLELTELTRSYQVEPNPNNPANVNNISGFIESFNEF